MADLHVVQPDDQLDPGPLPLEDSLDERLDAAVQRIKRLRERFDERSDQRDRWLERYDQWYAKVTQPLLEGIAYQESVVRALIEERLARYPKEKTVPLPHGTVRTRVGQTVVEVDDEDAFVHWAQDNGHTDLLRPPRQTWRVDKAAVHRAVGDGFGTQVDPNGTEVIVTAQGEVLPGVRLVGHPMTVRVITEAEEPF